VRDAVRVGGGNRLGKGQRDPQKLVQGHSTGRDEVGDRLAPHELHGEVVAPVALLDGVDGDDVRVVDRGENPGLAAKALDALGIRGEFRRDELQRDQAVESCVPRNKNLAPAAGSQPFPDLIVGENPPDRVVGRLGHLFPPVESHIPSRPTGVADGVRSITGCLFQDIEKRRAGDTPDSYGTVPPAPLNPAPAVSCPTASVPEAGGLARPETNKVSPAVRPSNALLRRRLRGDARP